MLRDIRFGLFIYFGIFLSSNIIFIYLNGLVLADSLVYNIHRLNLTIFSQGDHILVILFFITVIVL